LLGRAFVDDAMLVWPFGPERLDLITEFFRLFGEGIATNGWLWEAGAGVAAWIPPGSDAEICRSTERSATSSRARNDATRSSGTGSRSASQTSLSGTSTTWPSRPTNEVPGSAPR
jgi:hypothetical protein